jgi:hypothetical protein
MGGTGCQRKEHQKEAMQGSDRRVEKNDFFIGEEHEVKDLTESYG